jgi:hypothetical protein
MFTNVSDLHVKYRYFCPILIRLEFFGTDIRKLLKNKI